MKAEEYVLGIDVGSVTISVALLDNIKDVKQTGYIFHGGKVTESLKILLKDVDLTTIKGIAVTDSTPGMISYSGRYDNRLALIEGLKKFYPDAGSILSVGGEKFGLVLFDEEGNYNNYRANTSCAAGTGSFLDQQALRLNLDGIAKLSTIALNNKSKAPKIASRCAVFAKTDLIHAQQEGYSVSEIADGLCEGLARNITDTLFTVEKPEGTLIMAGGVALNQRVVEYLEKQIDKKIVVHDMAAHYESIGAAEFLLDSDITLDSTFKSFEDILKVVVEEKNYFYDDLSLSHTKYPDFSSEEAYLFTSTKNGEKNPVEVDLYQNFSGIDSLKGYLGIDVGSTSTKAVFLNDEDGEVAIGLYTRTAGHPVQAMQAILETLADISENKSLKIEVLGTGTTGSGRKFVGSILGADLILDEISAHARAAYAINKDVDTIIEIGGQDAKFTTMRNGNVTFSIMNNVCAAGTGSFIEEQAKKLGCSLYDYADRAMGKGAPIASDRCTVFMERDLNHYLAKGFTVDEVLASVLHSVRENYLTKVAVESNIGDVIFFQGATAKNKALVAAFEQRLQKPILVSEFCHLTGALGITLELRDMDIKTEFRGLDLYKANIPIESEVCTLCNNNCKITVADIDGEKVAYGFLCGRDYSTEEFVNNNASGFNLLKARNKIFNFPKKKEYEDGPVIGIPAALHMANDLPKWQYFFNELGIKTVTSKGYNDSVAKGKNLAGAEFCAPMSAVYGHVHYLLEKADYIFLPNYMDDDATDMNIRVRRQFCYYTQFAPSVVALSTNDEDRKRILSPLLQFIYKKEYKQKELYNVIKPIFGKRFSLSQIEKAFAKAESFFDDCQEQLQELYVNEQALVDDVSVVVLGRPYAVLDSSMNKGVLDIFGSLGVKTFFQDMIPYDDSDISDIRPLLNEMHWHFSTKILEAAEIAAKTDGMYPVLVTSFKCTPDSFVIDYLKKLMDSHGKPYLILQLDEHDSNVGYETRIEAALRSFRNDVKKHREKIGNVDILNRNRDIDPKGKTLLMPNWDELSGRFLVAGMKKLGFDARLMEENDNIIMKSLRQNTGQCLPINIIGQQAIDYITKYDLDPANTVVWSSNSQQPCNIGLYSYHIKQLLNSSGYEETDVFSGGIDFVELTYRMPLESYYAFMFGGYLRKMGCKVRPYEKVEGTTDRIIEESAKIIIDSFEGNLKRIDAAKKVVELFKTIETVPGQRPQVAIYGDMYVRDNDVINQDLVRYIEDNGGEVITTPYSDYAKMVSKPYLKKWRLETGEWKYFSSAAIMGAVQRLERKYYKLFQEITQEPMHAYDDDPNEIIEKFHMRIEHTGESLDNIIKVYYLSKYYPNLSLFVQTSPAFCCPSLITEAMTAEIEKTTGVPIVPITYDGTSTLKNDVIIPYLKYPRKRA